MSPISPFPVYTPSASLNTQHFDTALQTLHDVLNDCGVGCVWRLYKALAGQGGNTGVVDVEGLRMVVENVCGVEIAKQVKKHIQ